MGERTLNFGTDATDADYQVRDSDPAGGDLIIEHLPSGATFEYDATENAWIPTDPIGTSNRKAAAITTTAVNTDKASITHTSGVLKWDSGTGDGQQSISSGSVTKVRWDSADIDDTNVVDVKASSDEIDIATAGIYAISAYVRWEDSSNWSAGDTAQIRLFVNGSSTRICSIEVVDGGSVFSTVLPMVVEDLSANDTLDIRVFQSSGSTQHLSQDVGSGSPQLGRFSIKRIG